MRLSKRVEYGIKAAIRLASRHGQGYTQSRDIAANEGLPAKFLESILLSMRSATLLESKVGAGGGYRLARPPQRILIAEVVAAMERASTDGDVDPPPDTNGATRPGQVAVEVLQERMARALEESLGGLTLADLTMEVERRTLKDGSAMYHI